MLDVSKIENHPQAVAFCEAYLHIEPEKRMLLGRNIYGKGIADFIEVGSFIDDFTDETEFHGKPVIKSKDIPDDALVVSTLLGRPSAGEKKLQEVGVKHLDYFSFYENSGLNLAQVRFWGGFKKEFNNNREKFKWVETLLTDDESISTYENIISFRLSGNLKYMKNFSDREKDQYFENFLYLSEDDEVFVDVGGFDGFTSQEFIKKCPGFRAVYFFEPDTENFVVAKNRLDKYENVHLLQMGLSNQKETLKFSSGGSISAISEDGDIEIEVDALDELVDDAVSFIKMDIEGAEGMAIEGARKTILKNHPRLAICVYHKDTDFWKIPEQVLLIRHDYNVYLRHYTEGVAETVMFFIPK